jgi:hypothetical protein
VTTFEHALFGVTGVLAAGLHRPGGWQIAAVAAVAAVSPDWDGLTILGGAQAFAASHRLWGHNVLACLLTGILTGSLDYRFDLVTRTGRWLTRRLPLGVPVDRLRVRDQFTLRGFAGWVAVASLAALSHLLTDVVYSGSQTLPDWQLQPWWPFSKWACIYPLVRWGDMGASVILFGGAFAMLRWPRRLQTVSLVTLIVLGLYVVLRGQGFQA